VSWINIKRSEDDRDLFFLQRDPARGVFLLSLRDLLKKLDVTKADCEKAFEEKP
jgi:hypothetical protein